MKTFRVSTEDGDTYTVQAENLAEARRLASEQSSGRFTVYEERTEPRYSIPRRRR
jgi:hypothetical protein